jgi:hypothetical protein
MSEERRSLSSEEVADRLEHLEYIVEELYRRLEALAGRVNVLRDDLDDLARLVDEHERALDRLHDEVKRL